MKKADFEEEIKNNSIQIRDLTSDNASLNEQRKADSIIIDGLRDKLVHVNKGDETSVIALKQQLETMTIRYDTAERNRRTEIQHHGDARELLGQSRAENEELQQEIAGLQAQYDNTKADLILFQSTDSAHQRELQELNKQMLDAKSCNRCVVKASNEVTDAFFWEVFLFIFQETNLH